MIRLRNARPGRARKDRGQTLVEFSLALIPFMFLLMGVVDLGRGIYTNNGVAQAAREIARVTSVHQCTGPCTTTPTNTWSAEMTAVINTQKNLVPGLTSAGITITCVDVTDTPVTIAAGSYCPGGDYIKAAVTVTFRLVSPILPVPNPMSFSSTAHQQVP